VLDEDTRSIDLGLLAGGLASLLLVGWASYAGAGGSLNASKKGPVKVWVKLGAAPAVEVKVRQFPKEGDQFEIVLPDYTRKTVTCDAIHFSAQMRPIYHCKT
jgi:hypothetical protein